MRALAAATLLLASSAAGQDLQPTAGKLSHLRAAFDQWNDDSCAFLIAIVNGQEPVILCHGKDTKGNPASPQTYTPTASITRLLVADALHVQMKGRLAVPTGLTVGGKRPTYLELLNGTDLVPEYWDWRPGSTPLKREDLLACADIASKGETRFDWGCAGMSELLLMEPLILDGGINDWPSFIRTTLAPRASGLDPRDASKLTPTDRNRFSLSTRVAEHAKPTVLRLIANPKGLANWWQWRLRTSSPLWEGPRMGHLGKAERRDEVERWFFGDFGDRPVKCLALIYPPTGSGILCISSGPAKWIPDQADSLEAAFEADLFGELPPPGQAGAGGFFGARAKPNRPLAGWKGKQWGTTATSTNQARVTIEDATHRGLTFLYGDTTYQSTQVLALGNGRRVVLHVDAQRHGVLWLYPFPNRHNPKSLSAVFVERTALSMTPRILKLSLDTESPR